MEKVGHYRRVVWLQQGDRSLEDVLRARFRRVGANSLHEFEYTADQQCLVAHNSRSRGSQFLHLVVFERGAGAAVIPTVLEGDVAEAAEVRPPRGREYIQAQVFMRVARENVVWTTHNSLLRDASIYTLVAKLIESLGGRRDDTMFQFRAVVDAEAYRQAFNRGIEEIDLGLGDLQSTLEALAQDEGVPRVGFLDHLTALVTRRPNRHEVRAATKVEGRLSLRPGREWEDPQVVSLLTKMATNIVENYEDEFVIVTKDGLRLTRDRMSVSKDYRVQGNKRVLDAAGVAEGLADVFDRLRAAGVIEDEA